MSTDVSISAPDAQLRFQHIVETIAPLVKAGVAVHWLRPKSKAPVDNAWSEAPKATLESLKRAHLPGLQPGIRLGEPSYVGGQYIHLIDLDIRKPELAAVAWAKLLELWPDAKRFPHVLSGSGGESRHIYLATDRPFRSKKLAHSDGFTMVFDAKKGRDVKKWDWEIELFGTGKQAVLPPSIHPDTGKAYVWGRPLDLEAFDLGAGPVVPIATVRSWLPVQADPAEADDDSKPKLGLSIEDARKILADLPLADWCEDRDGWLQAGMALHHEFDGSDVGLELWNEFSKQSGKFDAKDQKRVWRSFRTKPNSVRMATLVKAAQIARFNAMFDEEDDFADPHAPPPVNDDDDDLLGDSGVEAEPRVGDEDDLIGDAPEPQSAHPDPKWKEKLDRNDKGAIKPTLHNLELIVRNDPRTRGVPQLNLFTQEVVMRGVPGRMKMVRESPKGTKQLDGPIWRISDPINGDLWSDAQDNAIRSVIEAPLRQGGYAIKVSDRDLKAAVDLTARQNAFHPVREYLETLKWDGTPRLATMFIRYLGADDCAYSREVARLTLLGGVVRAFEPGHKFDFVPILEGLQGKRKSTFIRLMGLRWAGELEGNFADRKAMVEKMQGALVMEIPELSAFSRSEVLEIKGFLSAQEDRVRLAYARRAQLFPRQCIFIGSTNEREYLRDNTGGRRFWPLTCHVDEIDTERFRIEVPQLWGEALQIYREMRMRQPRGTLPLYLTDEALSQAEDRQETRRVESPEDGLAGRIGAWLDTPIDDGFDVDDTLIDRPQLRQETCLLEIWVQCLRRDEGSYRQSEAQLLGRAMKRLVGWEAATPRKLKKWGSQRVYRRRGLISEESSNGRTAIAA